MVKLTLTKNSIIIIGEGDDSVLLELLSSLSTIEKMRSKNTYVCSISEIIDVLRIARNITDASQITDQTARDVYEKELTRYEATQQLLRNGAEREHEFLWPQQRLGVELAEINDRFGFFYDTRTGKTLMALQIMYNALKEGTATRCIVVCPSSIIASWVADAKMFPELKVVAYCGTDSNKKKALAAPSHIVIWSMELAAKNIETLKALKFDLCFVDESSKLKSHKSMISIAMLELSLTIPRWYLLSATPAPNGKHEYYTQMRTIDPYIFPSARVHFVNRFFNEMSRNPTYEMLVIKPEVAGAFMERIKRLSVYVDQSIMETAGKEWTSIEYSLPATLRSMYDSMKNSMHMEATDMAITVDMATQMRMKLMQISSGFVMDTEAIAQNKVNKMLGDPDREQEVHILDYSRVDALKTLLDTFGDEQVVVWANFKAEFDMIKEVLGDDACIVRGGSTLDDKMTAIANFRLRKFKYLVCHPLSVGMGINLTAAHIAVYYSLNDSWEALKQSSERIAGQIKVQPHKCQYFMLLAKDTVDKLVYDNVSNKRNASTDFLQYLQSGGNYNA